MGNWRFINSGANDGAFNMATDEVLAKFCDPETPVFRVYHWQPHTISIGYNQKTTDLNLDKCQNEGVGLVRRPTGGRAIFHAHEVTYSVIIPKTDKLYAHRSLSIYNQISTALVCGLHKLGLPAVMEKKENLDPEFKKYSERFSCFATSAKYEIHYQSRKLVGSAQRKFENALLQHGSILLGDKHLSLLNYLSTNGNGELKEAHKQLREKTVSIESILNRHVTFPEVVDAIKFGIEQTFQVKLKPDAISPSEHNRINELKPKYTELRRHVL